MILWLLAGPASLHLGYPIGARLSIDQGQTRSRSSCRASPTDDGKARLPSIEHVDISLARHQAHQVSFLY